jgi:hypothetical protein
MGGDDCGADSAGAGISDAANTAVLTAIGGSGDNDDGGGIDTGAGCGPGVPANGSDDGNGAIGGADIGMGVGADGMGAIGIGIGIGAAAMGAVSICGSATIGIGGNVAAGAAAAGGGVIDGGGVDGTNGAGSVARGWGSGGNGDATDCGVIAWGRLAGMAMPAGFVIAGAGGGGTVGMPSGKASR